ncbi:hypothetical protein LAZ67_7002223 [Cordylochernes scorpioides]|uniref:RNA-directed DNA polymerase n=1 Tax=Cordylochernes scorpioides TaxID=51811 RepID=A0ABY6KN34_9ARAC|nr:hypothetical protein LAZ67_7002223 [Cordylochernes scorpioides]
MKQRLVWPGMKNDIRKYVSSCPICQRDKFKYKSRPSKMSLPHQSRVPFHTVHVDFAEVTSNIKDKNSTFLLIIDEATRVVQAKAMKQHGRALIKYFNEHEDLKSVRTIVSDQGRSFVYVEFPRWATSKDIRLITTSPYHPAGNGLAERAIRDIKTFLSCYPHFKGGWKNSLEAAVRYHNRSYNSYLGCSPLFKLTKTSPVLPAEKEFNLHCPFYETEKSQIEQNLYRQRTNFYFNSQSATEALRAFRTFKGIRSGKSPLCCYSLRRMIKFIEKTGSLEAKLRSGRPSTCKSVAVTVSQNFEAIETLSTYGELKVIGFDKRQEFAAWVFRKIDIDEANFSLNGEVNPQNSRIWTTENPRNFTEMPLYQPRVTVWLRKGYSQIALSEITFMQDGGPPHISRGAKQLLKDTFSEDRPPRSPDLTPCDFWLWGYIRSRVYRCRPTTLAMLKASIRQFIINIINFNRYDI